MHSLIGAINSLPPANICREYDGAFGRCHMTYATAHAAHEETLTGATGLRLFTRSWRPAGAARAVVVFVHGFNSHGGYYRWAADQLVDRGFSVYAVDLRGRGKSDGERFFVRTV